MSPPVAVAVVSWNTRELLDACLLALRPDADSGLAEVHVVDNASSDGSPELVRARHPWATLHEPGENLGFGPAVDLVARATRAPWLAVANADTAPRPGALAALIDAGEREPRAGILAPRLVHPDGATQHSVHRFPTIPFRLAFALGLHALPGLGDHWCIEGRWDPDRERWVDWALGAFLLVRRSAYEASGGFEPTQWMYAEDLDIAWRARRVGSRTRYVPAAVVEHAESSATARAWGVARHDRRAAATTAWLVRRRGRTRARLTSAIDVLGARARAGALRARRGEGWRIERARAAAAAHRRGLAPPSVACAGGRAPDVPLRIAVLVDRFPELSETFVATEVLELRRQGHAVRVEALAPPQLRLPGVPGDLRVDVAAHESTAERLRALGWLAVRHPAACLADLAHRGRWAREDGVRPLRHLAPAARRLVLGGEEAMHVHFAAGAALDALRLERLVSVPYTLTAHAYDIFQRPANLAEKLGAAALVTSGCVPNVEHLRGISPGTRVEEIVMGVDLERFRRTAPHAARRHVVAIGRLVEKKGFGDLVEAAAMLRERGLVDRVTIAGDGPLRDELAGRVAELGLEDVVALPGAIEPAGVRELLEGAAVLAAPCVIAADGDRDSMPVVVKEALAMEVPVVTSDVMGLAEIVEDPWGRLVPGGDRDALADALAEMLALPVEERACRGAAGREAVAERASLVGETRRLARLIADAVRTTPIRREPSP